MDRCPQPGTVWNRLTAQEEETILREALRQPEPSSRELACWVTDHADFSVSESSVYRVLKRHGLIREVQVLGFPAGKEYRVKTTRINEQWQSDASYLFVVGWGWYYAKNPISCRDGLRSLQLSTERATLTALLKRSYARRRCRLRPNRAAVRRAMVSTR